jgi:transposase
MSHRHQYIEEKSAFVSTQTTKVLSCLLPDANALRFEACHIDEAAAQITLWVRPIATVSSCPLCAMPAHRIHSHYQRTLEDLTWADYRVRLRLEVRKWFCDQTTCRRRIFTERLPTVVAPWARRTLRLAQRWVALALALGGRAGVRLSQRWGLNVSRNTLLRLIRRLPRPVFATPRALGVDDWSLRKRHTYGTILVDLQTHQPIDLLEDREADTLAQWLQAHPGVEIVSRDRSKAYEEGIRQGAPGAIQVADRFHLLQNLAETLDHVFNAHVKTIDTFNQARSQTPVSQPGGTQAAPVPPPLQPNAALVKAQQRRAGRLAIYEQVWSLHRQGYAGYAIAKQLGIGKSTVFRYLRASTFPERKGRSDRGRSVLDPYKPYLLSRWNEGCREALQLFGEIKTQGYRGSYVTVARYAQRLRQAQGLSPRQRLVPKPVLAVSELETPLLTPRRATWLVLTRPDKRKEADEQVLTDLQGQHWELADAVTLARDFADLVRERQPDQLDAWLERAASSTLDAFERFAKRLREDYDSIKAGVTLPWSNGPVEGQINRLKMLKRQMFGRAKLDLLRQRFLQWV